MDVSYNPDGPCYLKSGIGAAYQNANIIGGRLIDDSQSAPIKLKLHRKRVFRKPAEPKNQVQKRSSPYGPAFTFTRGTTTTTQTTTSTSVRVITV
jgi:hypothetical protein